ncbi:MAG: hypothetical protein HYV45_03065 [Candidatus Moranbacteria bacterium]|nr:hypothetical protein [Candidatus Moranbacteria bacterium]
MKFLRKMYIGSLIGILMVFAGMTCPYNVFAITSSSVAMTMNGAIVNEEKNENGPEVSLHHGNDVLSGNTIEKTLNKCTLTCADILPEALVTKKFSFFSIVDGAVTTNGYGNFKDDILGDVMSVDDTSPPLLGMITFVPKKE